MSTHRTMNDFARLIALASILIIAPVSLQAQLADTGGDGALEISIGYGRSDNVARTDINTTDSGITRIGLDANLDIERPRFDLSLLSDLSFISYAEDLVDDRISGGVDARLTTHLVQNRLDWFVANNFSQLRINPAVGDVPDNLREFNVITTGLNGNLPTGARTILGVSVQYGDRSVKDLQDLDSTEISAGLNLVRQIRPTTRVSLMVNGSNIKYDDAIGTEYDIYRAFLRYQSELASGEVTLDVGASKLDHQTATVSTDAEPLFRLSWTRDITERSRLLISGSHETTDLGGAASIGDASGIDQGRSSRFSPTSSPFRESRGDIVLQTNYESTALQFIISGVNQQYEDPLEDNFDLLSAGIGILRQLPSEFTVSLSGRVGERTSHSTGLKGRDTAANIALRRSLGRRLAVALTYSYRRRTDSTTGGYSENQYRLDFIGQIFED